MIIADFAHVIYKRANFNCLVGRKRSLLD